MKLLSYLLVLCGVWLSHSGANAQTDLPLVPYPQKVQRHDGAFIFSKKVKILAEEAAQATAKYLEKELQGKLPVKVSAKAKKNSIYLRLNPALKEQLGQEGYQLEVTEDQVKITAANPTGLFYGVQTLKQLLPVDLVNTPLKSWEIPALSIEDRPRFAWRAFMLDESRHFRGKEFVKMLLDQMALLKMNTFHWHLTDDQGWRIEIKKYPKLTEIGSKRKDTQIGGWNSEKRSGEPHEGFYTQEEIKELVQYAAERHITVVPEIEMPGHASAAIAAYPWLGTTGKQIEVPVIFGKMEDSYNVANQKVYRFLEDVLTETMALFPSKVIHIGGDEVKFEQWKNSVQIQELMKKEGLKSPADVQIYFTNKISNFIDSKGRRMMGWNEILGGNVHEWQAAEDVQVGQSLAKSAVIHFWKGDLKLVNQAVEQGYDIVNSLHSFTYLDYNYQSIPLQKAYGFDPVPKGLNPKYHQKVLGLGCQMWGEWTATEERTEHQVFPRISAYAEVGWTNLDQKDFARYQSALKSLQMRWDALGIRYTKEVE
ncbi:beta-N-acetylhexosaminidase [Rapidithrix thailandica]|uniref:beta-N-acetylhexosaminidase n=1 Tax=Rapidithrix thailandica TaxID=413964 RepID=A0AAW9SJY4_9BACT